MTLKRGSGLLVWKACPALPNIEGYTMKSLEDPQTNEFIEAKSQRSLEDPQTNEFIEAKSQRSLEDPQTNEFIEAKSQRIYSHRLAIM